MKEKDIAEIALKRVRRVVKRREGSLSPFVSLGFGFWFLNIQNTKKKLFTLTQ